MSHEGGEDADSTEEKMEHDAPHPSSIEEFVRMVLNLLKKGYPDVLKGISHAR